MENKWIDKYKARLFVVMSLLILALYIVTLFYVVPFSKGIELAEKHGFNLVGGIAGFSSSLVMIILLIVHADSTSYWGNAKDALTFILIGSIMTIFLSLIQISKAFLPLFP